MIGRELTGGVYFGKRDRYQTEDRGEEATDLMAYSEMEIERIGRRAFELARLRRKKVTSVDKANVLATSRLWREVMHRLAAEYPDVEFEDMLVDNTAMQLVKNPSQFDVVVTENMFGDILSDEASMLAGSLGMLPSASLGATAPGLYEPSHGSAPKYAGLDKANPIATILSVAMMFKLLPEPGLPRHRPSRTPWMPSWQRAGTPMTSPAAGKKWAPRRWGSSFGNTCKRLSFSKMTVFCRSTA